MKKRSEKEVIVADLKDRFSRHEAAILTGYRGLTVAQLEEFRDELKKAGGDIERSQLGIRFYHANSPRLVAGRRNCLLKIYRFTSRLSIIIFDINII